MKLRSILLLKLILSLIAISSYGQSSTLIICSTTEDNFYLHLNNVLQNDTAKTYFTVNNLDLTVYELKIEFEDIYLESIEKTIHLIPNSTSIFNIEKKNTGKYKLVLVNQEINKKTQNTTNNFNNNFQQYNSSFNSLFQSVTSDLEILIDEANIENIIIYGTKPTGCNPNVDINKLAQIKQLIISKSVDYEKLKIAKQFTSSHCLKAEQVKEIMQLIIFEEDKLIYAKYAYHYTSDFNNYSIVNSIFEFSTSVDELNDYINSLQ